jgi:hypothetical protein
MLIFEVVVDESGKLLQDRPVSSTGIEAAVEPILRKMSFSEVKYQGSNVRWISLLGLCFLENPRGAVPCAPDPSAKTNNGAESHPQRVLMIGGLYGTYQKDFQRVLINPEYSGIIKSTRLQGTANVRVIVDGNGNVSFTKAMHGAPILEETSVAAIRHWKYRPLMWDKHPVEVEFDTQINYSLTGP